MPAARLTSIVPRLMGADEAAAYLGVGTTTLRSLGIPRKVLGARRLYDRLTLDAYASELPVEGELEENPCDEAFGRASG